MNIFARKQPKLDKTPSDENVNLATDNVTRICNDDSLKSEFANLSALVMENSKHNATLKATLNSYPQYNKIVNTLKQDTESNGDAAAEPVAQRAMRPTAWNAVQSASVMEGNRPASVMEGNRLASRGGRRRTKNAKYYNKRRRTKRRRSKRRRSNKRRA